MIRYVVLIISYISLVMSIQLGDKCGSNSDCETINDGMFLAFCNGLGVCSMGVVGNMCKEGWNTDCRYGLICANGRCNAAKKIGEACSHKDDCLGIGVNCINQKCSYLSKEGGLCESSFHCVDQLPKLKCVSSKCTAIPTKDFGAACADDFECKLFCTEQKVCYGASTGGGGKCTQDYECTGSGGYCCAKTGQCGGPNSCN